MKNEWESRDWMATQPEERRPQLSPFEMSLIEATRNGRTVIVHGQPDTGDTIEWGTPPQNE